MASRIEKLLVKGRKHEGRGRLDRALAEYRKAVALDPHDPDLWVLVGETAVAAGDSTSGAEALFRAADMHFRGGLLESALELARRVVAADEHHAGGRLFLRKLEPRVAAMHAGKGPGGSSVASVPLRAQPGPGERAGGAVIDAGQGGSRERSGAAGSVPDAAGRRPVRPSFDRLPSIILADDLQPLASEYLEESTEDLGDDTDAQPTLRRRRPADPDPDLDPGPAPLVQLVAEEPSGSGPDPEVLAELGGLGPAPAEDALELDEGPTAPTGPGEDLSDEMYENPEMLAALDLRAPRNPAPWRGTGPPGEAPAGDPGRPPPAGDPQPSPGQPGAPPPVGDPQPSPGQPGAPPPVGDPQPSPGQPGAPPPVGDPQPSPGEPGAPEPLRDPQAPPAGPGAPPRVGAPPATPDRARRSSGPIDMSALEERDEPIAPELLSLAGLLAAPEDGGHPAGIAELPLDDLPSVRTVRSASSALAGSALFADLDQELVDHLFDAGTFTQRRAGRVLFEQGDRGTSLYVIVRGQVDVLRRDADGQDVRLATLRAGAFFGEMSLLTDLPRTATVRARTDVVLLEVPRRTVRSLISRDAAVLKRLMRFFRGRLVGTLLEVSPLFGGFSRDEKRALITRFRFLEVGPRRRLITEGEPVAGLYLVLAGALGVTRGADAIAQLGPGDVIGEISLLDDGAATASVETATRTWCLLLPREEFRALIARHPGVREHLARVAAERRAAIDGSRLEPV